MCLVALVFSLSLNMPPDKGGLKNAIYQLVKTDFLDYESFVEKEVDAYAALNLACIAQGVNERLDALGLRVFQLHHIGEVLGEPLHVSKLLTEDLILKKEFYWTEELF